MRYLRNKSSMRNYPLFIINEKNEVLAYLVKFRNTTGILSANQQSIPVILLQDFKDYLVVNLYKFNNLMIN